AEVEDRVAGDDDGVERDARRIRQIEVQVRARVAAADRGAAEGQNDVAGTKGMVEHQGARAADVERAVASEVVAGDRSGKRRGRSRPVNGVYRAARGDAECGAGSTGEGAGVDGGQTADRN